MQQLDVTDDQLAYLERIRSTLESEYLGPYGHVTSRDALQYLIDVHEATAPEMPSVDVGVVEATVPEGRAVYENGSVVAHAEDGTPDPATNGADAASVDETAGTTETTVESSETDEDADDGNDETTAGADTDEESETGAETDASDGGDESETTDDGDSSFDPDSGDNDRLQAMMNLLETHDEKWREGDGEARYEIDLPDGSTETVQTRDDVRAVLFKNYR